MDGTQKVDEEIRNIGQFIIIAPGVMFIKMLKMTHSEYLLLITAKDHSQLGQNTELHLKDIIWVFHKIL